MASILVIDDDQQLRTMIKQMLEREGHTIQEAENGAVGVEMYRKQASDVIISDLVMPEKDGLAAIQEIAHQFPRARIIAMSGGSRGKAAWLPIAKRAGAMEVIKKPFNREQLVTILDKVLSDPWK